MDIPFPLYIHVEGIKEEHKKESRKRREKIQRQMPKGKGILKKSAKKERNATTATAYKVFHLVWSYFVSLHRRDSYFLCAWCFSCLSRGVEALLVLFLTSSGKRIAQNAWI
ncbi:hypothetical protein AVEN_29956-1 [Araneus ventricosus]|uniref:Uncharacterized protein n=1 Tax=Araneus ventricosus TaxID=182803 RepID=A0A4Y2GUJ5_ARAVE|nr:hypothetical protein AVEN_29956-1 [Araneus ventricosus]